MKKMKRLLAMVMTVMMVLSLATTAFAAGTGTITITPPDNIDADVTNTYKIYKVFDAVGDGTNISYKLVEGKENAPAGFNVDDAGNVTYTGTGTEGQLTTDDIAAIAAYVTENDLVQEVTSTGSEAAVASNLPNGYYYITTTTGTAVAITSTNPNANVTDKNKVPELNKKITGANSMDADGKNALAQVGSTVEFEVTIKVENGAKGYIFHDTMESSLSYNNDVAVYIDGVQIDASNYDTTTKAGDTITVTFNDEWISTQVGKTITIKYSATVTSDALTTDPANNTAYLDYGNKYSTEEVTTNVYNAKFTVTKKDGNGEPLAGAGFVIAKTVADDSEDAAEGATKTVYYKLENNVVTWVDSIDEATEHFSDENGEVPAFTGLANGTYILIEKTVPEGYNKAENSTFTINDSDYTEVNLEQAATVINNAGTQLPSTGGMGTTLFYIFGGIMVLAAVVLLVTKKRMSVDE